MKIMWFTNIPMPDVYKHIGKDSVGSGHWMSCLLNEILTFENLQICVVTVNGNDDIQFISDGVEYKCIPEKNNFKKIQIDQLLLECVHFIKDWKPDLLHIHGTERFFGLLGARNMVQVPCLISLQGIINAIIPKYFGSLSFLEIVQSQRIFELLSGRGFLWQFRRYNKWALLEKEILSGNRFYTGQTDWDLAYAKAYNPSSIYYRVDRILRKPFYRFNWDISKIRRHSIFFSNAGNPLRDVDSILQALCILKNKYPDVTLSLAGIIRHRNGYYRFIKKKIQNLGIENRVFFLDYLDAEEMASELTQNHVFVAASHIENESNSLCEAMLTGMPCVASFAGGMPTTIEADSNGLFFPMGDAVVMAYQIRRIFDDDYIAKTLGANSQALARKRHEPSSVVAHLLRAYSDVLAKA